MAKVAYYPGCALEGSGGPYDRSTRQLVKALGLEMENLRDYNCCGAMEVKNVHPMLQTYLRPGTWRSPPSRWAWIP